jgi:CRP/FNR family transcriptional regulator
MTDTVGPKSATQAGPDDLAIRARDLFAPFATRRHFARGSLLWREGDDTGYLVSLLAGHVKVHRVLPSGAGVTLFLFGPGEVFGFMPFLDGQPYPANAQALTDVTADVVPRAALLTAVQRDPEIALALVRLLASRLRAAFQRIEQSAAPDVQPRVAAALAALAAEADAAGEGSVIQFPVAAAEMAAALGIAPETFSRAVTRLVSAGALHRLGPRSFQVLDRKALEAAAREGRR